MNIENELKIVGLTLESYEEFLQDCADKINGVSDIDWSEIIEKYNLPYDRRRISESMGRNILGGNFVREFYKNKTIGKTNDDVIKDLVRKEQDIYKAKRKLQDERNELNRLLRNEARYEEDIKLLEEKLESIGEKRYPLLSNRTAFMSSDDGVCFICLSDLHIGANHSSTYGNFNTEIAKDRLNEYLKEIRNIAHVHNVDKCVVAILGDNISGNIHLTLQISNRENVIEQIKLTCEMIADFIYELKSIFTNIEIYSVSGNHSRVEKNKDNSVLGEELDNLVPWFLSHIFAHDKSVYVGLEMMDDTYSSFDVCGKTYTIVHGDYDGINDTAIQKLCAYLGYFPYAIIMGHKHHPAMNEVSGVKVIQSGSLCGSGDDFTVKSRLKGSPSQTVLICSNKGIKAIYPIELN